MPQLRRKVACRRKKKSEVSNSFYRTANYSRQEFGSRWQDLDNNGLNSREEALIELSTVEVTVTVDTGQIIRGRWISPFTGKVIFDASKLDADHIVPLKYAWDRGADQWSYTKRVQFANDLLNIWPVEASLNRSKGARGITEWLPPKGQCAYIARFIRVTKIYSLEHTVLENRQHSKLLKQCNAQHFERKRL